MDDWTDAARKLAQETTAAASEWQDSVCATPGTD